MNRVLTIILWLLTALPMVAQSQSIRWTSFDHLDDSLRTERKQLLIFIRTDWCKYCKIQENVTFEDSELVELLNLNYYCLRLDGEETDSIRFLGRTYGFQPSRGYHELAEHIGRQNDELIFPTTVLLSEDFQLVRRFQGLQKAEELMQHHAGFH